MDMVATMVGIRSYIVDMDSDCVYVETRRFPSTKIVLREIPKDGPRAQEARRLAVKSRALRAKGF
jgi:hypothetical protein